MRNVLFAAAAALTLSVTASYAATATIDGTFSLTYSATNGNAADMAFGNVPGSTGGVSVTGTQTTDLGAHTMSGQTVTNNPFFLDGASHPSQNVLPALTVGSPFTAYFFTANPSGSCDGCSGGANGTATGNITASFTFTEPNGATGTFSDTAVYSAKYASPSLACDPGHTQSDCVVWANSSPTVVHFNNGDLMTVTLNDAHDWAITPTVTFDVTSYSNTRPVVPAPEPASLALLGTAIAGMGLARRRRNRR